MKKFLLALLLCNIACGQGTSVFPYTTPLWRTFLDGTTAEFQADSDSTTFFQVLDADGGTPILNIDSTNERFGLGTASPEALFDARDGNVLLTDADVSGPATAVMTSANAYGKLFPFHATAGGLRVIGASDNATTLATSLEGIIGSTNPTDTVPAIRLRGAISNGATSIAVMGNTETVLQVSNFTTNLVTVLGFGNVGFGRENAPETLIELTLSTPYMTWHNSTHEDSDGGRESRLNFKGEQSGGEETTLARIQVQHDGAADDEKGEIIISTNDGSDTDTPTDRFKIDAAGTTYIGDAGATTFWRTQSDGDTYWTGTGAGLVYGHMYVDGTQVIVVALTANTPAEVKDDGTTSLDDGWLTGELNEMTFPSGGDEHYISVTVAGKYEATWDISFAQNTPTAAIDIHGGVAIDGTPLRDSGEAHRTVANSSDTGNMGGTTIIDCPNGNEQLSLWVENTTNNTDIDVEHANLRVALIGGT
jgi:hypothetical protein